MSARERIKLLLDDASLFDELMGFAAYNMYQEQGGCPSGATVVGFMSWPGLDDYR
ncbi:MAG: hypothetical protein R2865_09865 [Deinococcales bacterium]